MDLAAARVGVSAAAIQWRRPLVPIRSLSPKTNRPRLPAKLKCDTVAQTGHRKPTPVMKATQATPMFVLNWAEVALWKARCNSEVSNQCRKKKTCKKK